MIDMPDFMKTGIGVQAILRFGLRNFRGCKAGTTEMRAVFKYAAQIGSSSIIKYGIIR
jgi:hypothetical protein